MQSCILLGVGGVVFGGAAVVARQPAARSEFVVINGWVLPSRYFRNERA
ncbi:hypothetical protein [Pseudomonas sp. Leaf58]|nr:hypothetical protein [Pseudomonas sp. Leaf58]